MGKKWGNHGIPYVRGKNKNKKRGASSPCSSESSVSPSTSSNKTEYMSPVQSFDSSEGANELTSESVFIEPLSASPPLIDIPIAVEIPAVEKPDAEVKAYFVDAKEHMRVIRELKYADEPSFEYLANLPSMARVDLELPENEPPLKIIEAVAKYARNEVPIPPRDIPDRPKVFGKPMPRAGRFIDEETLRFLYPNDPIPNENEVVYSLPKSRRIMRREKFTKPVEEKIVKFSYKTPKDIPVIADEDPDSFIVIPDPPKPTFQKIDYDSFDQPPRIKYGFGTEEVKNAKPDEDDSDAVRRKMKNENEHVREQFEAYRYQRLYLQRKHKASNVFDPSVKKRENVVEYIENMAFDKSYEQHRIMHKLDDDGEKQRIRRKNIVGSYPWNSVDEKNMFEKKDTIMRFTWKGKLTKLKKFLRNPYNHKYINEQDNAGRTAVHFAASWDCPQTLSELLKVPGVKVNLTDDEGKTPLRKAVEIDSLECVQMLIDFGANARIEALDKRNPFEMAIQQKGDAALPIIKCLYSDGMIYKEKKYNGCMSHMHQVCIAKRALPIMQTARFLLENGAYVNITEGTGQTPLMLAASYEKPDLVRLFLEYGADVRHLDTNFQSALNWARPNEACHKILKEAMECATGYAQSSGRGDNTSELESASRPVTRAMPSRKETTSRPVTRSMPRKEDNKISKADIEKRRRIIEGIDLKCIPDLHYDRTYKPKPCPVNLFYARPFVNEALAKQHHVPGTKNIVISRPGPGYLQGNRRKLGSSSRH